MSTVLLPMKRPVRPPPPPPVADGGAGEPVLLPGTRPDGTPPPFAVVVPTGAWLVGLVVPLPFAEGVAAELLDAPGGDVLSPLVAAVPAVVLDDAAAACP